jgi:hypothetical protein
MDDLFDEFSKSLVESVPRHDRCGGWEPYSPAPC